VDSFHSLTQRSLLVRLPLFLQGLRQRPQQRLRLRDLQHLRRRRHFEVEREFELVHEARDLGPVGTTAGLAHYVPDDRADRPGVAFAHAFGGIGVGGEGRSDDRGELIAAVDRREPLMTDLMFSCRIQSKRVEHAFLAWLIRKYIAETNRDFHADYRKTPRNAASGQVFADLALEEIENRNGVLSLRFPAKREVPEDGVIDVTIQEAMVVTPA